MSQNHITKGLRTQYLGIAVGKTDGVPVGVITIRAVPDSFQTCDLMLDRPSLERLVEDIQFVLTSYQTLKEAPSMDPALRLYRLNELTPRLS